MNAVSVDTKPVTLGDSPVLSSLDAAEAPLNYDHRVKLVEIHEEYLLDKGHQKV
jgi:hypothetical protein